MDSKNSPILHLIRQLGTTRHNRTNRPTSGIPKGEKQMTKTPILYKITIILLLAIIGFTVGYTAYQFLEMIP